MNYNFSTGSKRAIHWNIITRQNLKQYLGRHTITSFLTRKETATYGRLRTRKRKQEWLLGRYAVKLIVSQLARRESNTVALHRIEVANNAAGAPQLSKNPLFTKAKISISHCGSVAIGAVLAGHGAIGADVELIRKLRPSVRDYILTKEEEQWATNPQQIITCWSLKEAIAKLNGEGLQFNPKKTKVLFRDGTYHALDSRIKLHTFTINNYAVSLAVKVK